VLWLIMDLANKSLAVGYARSSTLLNQNPDLQLEQIRKFSTARNFNLFAEYVDQGVSGSKEKRPALDQLVSDARKGLFTILIVTGIDRLARNVRHLLNLISELDHYGVSIISLRENIDFSTPMGQATLTIIGAVAQLERELIRERIRTALASKKLMAQRTGSGWRCGRKSKINDSVTSNILELRNQGKSIRK